MKSAMTCSECFRSNIRCIAVNVEFMKIADITHQPRQASFFFERRTRNGSASVPSSVLQVRTMWFSKGLGHVPCVHKHSSRA